ncbi:hypothetical protein EVAR_47438_1 [Eumeta japonica]|uniref:Uncharacterized protein n=1 Tax=Eumeta variegata TaxID=151549 RepID=A0A4C1XC87_EUMVA|nr:hypothetical protein EVAR_47438_1 [Eumeta japonica]
MAAAKTSLMTSLFSLRPNAQRPIVQMVRMEASVSPAVARRAAAAEGSALRLLCSAEESRICIEACARGGRGGRPRARAPPGKASRVVIQDNKEAGARVEDDPRLAAVGFVKSAPAGPRVTRRAPPRRQQRPHLAFPANNFHVFNSPRVRIRG